MIKGKGRKANFYSAKYIRNVFFAQKNPAFLAQNHIGFFGVDIYLNALYRAAGCCDAVGKIIGVGKCLTVDNGAHHNFPGRFGYSEVYMAQKPGMPFLIVNRDIVFYDPASAGIGYLRKGFGLQSAVAAFNDSVGMKGIEARLSVCRERILRLVAVAIAAARANYRHGRHVCSADSFYRFIYLIGFDSAFRVIAYMAIYAAAALRK